MFLAIHLIWQKTWFITQSHLLPLPHTLYFEPLLISSAFWASIASLLNLILWASFCSLSASSTLSPVQQCSFLEFIFKEKDFCKLGAPQKSWNFTYGLTQSSSSHMNFIKIAQILKLEYCSCCLNHWGENVQLNKFT